jgi:hypothetical protein
MSQHFNKSFISSIPQQTMKEMAHRLEKTRMTKKQTIRRVFLKPKTNIIFNIIFAAHENQHKSVRI